LLGFERVFAFARHQAKDAAIQTLVRLRGLRKGIILKAIAPQIYNFEVQVQPFP
jgi:hypothetical protein